MSSFKLQIKGFPAEKPRDRYSSLQSVFWVVYSRNGNYSCPGFGKTNLERRRQQRDRETWQEKGGLGGTPASQEWGQDNTAKITSNGENSFGHWAVLLHGNSKIC